ncbi:hypothetical protein pb186bvf_003247 [Paramecium bursaria]
MNKDQNHQVYQQATTITKKSKPQFSIVLSNNEEPGMFKQNLARKILHEQFQSIFFYLNTILYSQLIYSLNMNSYKYLQPVCLCSYFMNPNHLLDNHKLWYCTGSLNYDKLIFLILNYLSLTFIQTYISSLQLINGNHSYNIKFISKSQDSQYTRPSVFIKIQFSKNFLQLILFININKFWHLYYQAMIPISHCLLYIISQTRRYLKNFCILQPIILMIYLLKQLCQEMLKKILTSQCWRGGHLLPLDIQLFLKLKGYYYSNFPPSSKILLIWFSIFKDIIRISSSHVALLNYRLTFTKFNHSRCGSSIQIEMMQEKIRWAHLKQLDKISNSIDMIYE